MITNRELDELERDRRESGAVSVSDASFYSLIATIREERRLLERSVPDKDVPCNVHGWGSCGCLNRDIRSHLEKVR